LRRIFILNTIRHPIQLHVGRTNTQGVRGVSILPNPNLIALIPNNNLPIQDKTYRPLLRLDQAVRPEIHTLFNDWTSATTQKGGNTREKEASPKKTRQRRLIDHSPTWLRRGLDHGLARGLRRSTQRWRRRSTESCHSLVKQRSTHLSTSAYLRSPVISQHQFGLRRVDGSPTFDNTGREKRSLSPNAAAPKEQTRRNLTQLQRSQVFEKTP
jgi:hypothetical protein